MVTLYAPAKSGRAANVSDETHGATESIIAWGLARWPSARALREVALGTRRIDVLFVLESDLFGVEIKGPKDSLDRLEAQVREYGYWLPRTYVALHTRFKSKVEGKWIPNLLWIDGDTVSPAGGAETERSDLCCSRLLELLWRDEAVSVAVRTEVIPQFVPKTFTRGQIQSMLARMLTGHQVVKQVCTELRARTMVGMGSAEPVRTRA